MTFCTNWIGLGSCTIFKSKYDRIAQRYDLKYAYLRMLPIVEHYYASCLVIQIAFDNGPWQCHLISETFS